MTTITRDPAIPKNFTMVYNSILQDQSLSWEAKGLYAYLLSLPSNWNIHVSHLINHFKAGKTKIYRIFNELIEYGICKRETLRASNGTFEVVQYTVLNRVSLKKSLPCSGYPETDHPETGNQPLQILKENKYLKEKKDKRLSPKISPEVTKLKEHLQEKLNEQNSLRKPISDSQAVKHLKPLLTQYSEKTDLIYQVIDWIFLSNHPKAEFWKTIIQGPKSLQKNFDSLVVQMGSLKKNDPITNIKLAQKIAGCFARENLFNTAIEIKSDSMIFVYHGCQKEPTEIRFNDSKFHEKLNFYLQPYGKLNENLLRIASEL